MCLLKLATTALVVLGLAPIEAVAQSPSGPPAIIASIDGSKSPESIPDAIAYRHFFDLIGSKPDTQTADDTRRRSYLRHFFRPGCGPQRTEDRTLSDEQAEKLIRLGDETARRIRAAGAAKSPNATTGSAEAQLQKQREEASIVEAAVAGLGQSVDADAAAKVRRHIVDHMKSHIKLVTLRVPVARTAAAR